MIETFAGIKQRWANAGLASTITGGIANDVKERTPRPYAVIKPLFDTTETRTNKGRYDAERFEIALVGDTLELVGAYTAVVITALTAVPIVPSVGKMLRFRSIQTRYEEQDTYHIATTEFTALVGL